MGLKCGDAKNKEPPKIESTQKMHCRAVTNGGDGIYINATLFTNNKEPLHKE
jgi:hypothetical protein